MDMKGISWVGDIYQKFEAMYFWRWKTLCTRRQRIKKTSPTCSSQKRKRHLSAERASKIKLRRQDLYTQLSVDKKETLLSRRRVKNLESASCSVFVERANEASCSGIGVELPRQKALTIREPSFVTKKAADTSCTNNPMTPFEKGKNIPCHFSIYEIGSTSTAATESHDPTTSLIAEKVVDASCTNNPTAASDKEKDTPGHFSIFEIGSTSAAATESRDPTTSLVAKKCMSDSNISIILANLLWTTMSYITAIAIRRL